MKSLQFGCTNEETQSNRWLHIENSEPLDDSLMVSKRKGWVADPEFGCLIKSVRFKKEDVSSLSIR